MRIKEINIINFKGFQNKTFSFNDKLTVVFGDNATGKTTLLKAIQVGLGAYLQSLNQLLGGQMYRRNFSPSDKYKAFDPSQGNYVSKPGRTRITISADFPITLDGNADKGGVSNALILDYVPVSWYRDLVGNHTTHTKECVGELIDLVKKMEGRRNNDKLYTIYPLILSLGAKRKRDTNSRTIYQKNERISRIEKAYMFAIHDKVDFAGPNEWLRRYVKNIKDKKEFEGTKEAFLEALQTAVSVLTEIDFNNNFDEIEALVSVGSQKSERHLFSNMSEGLQSMIGIVCDIAHRCIQLNGFYGKDAIKKTPGVVLIDDVEVFLHPSWQKHVLQDFMKAFPNIQFIVTTHCPFIVQDLGEEHLIRLDENASGK